MRLRRLFLVRLLAGGVFLSEGIQKFLYPAELSAGRFAKIGVPAPQIMGPLVGVCEVPCGTLLIIGLLTRLHVARASLSARGGGWEVVIRRGAESGAYGARTRNLRRDRAAL